MRRAGRGRERNINWIFDRTGGDSNGPFTSPTAADIVSVRDILSPLVNLVQHAVAYRRLLFLGSGRIRVHVYRSAFHLESVEDGKTTFSPDCSLFTLRPRRPLNELKLGLGQIDDIFNFN
jgi:hypothetical protein